MKLKQKIYTFTGLQEFDALSSAEVNDFRFKMRKLGDEIAQTRSRSTWKERLYYQFPPRLAPALSDALDHNGNVVVISKFENDDVRLFPHPLPSVYHSTYFVLQNSFSFNVRFSITPNELLEMILAKRANVLQLKGERTHDYVLKVSGRDEYLVGDDYQLIQFQYIQDAIWREVNPTVVTMSVHSVPSK